MMFNAKDLAFLRYTADWPSQTYNFYMTGPDCDSWQHVQSLVCQGLMVQTALPRSENPDLLTFTVTAKGLQTLKVADIVRSLETGKFIASGEGNVL